MSTSSSNSAARHALVPWREFFGVMFNPGQVIKGRMDNVSWPWAYAISGSAFFLFFLQSGLDLLRTGRADILKAGFLALAGGFWGTGGIAGMAAVAWVLCRPFGSPGSRYSFTWTLRSFALGYSPALIYTALGLMANLLLGWNTALAFGATGVLWSLGPNIAVLREMLASRLMPSVLLATLFGGVTLLVWGLLLAV
jgi:hypothetical protein